MAQMPSEVGGHSVRPTGVRTTSPVLVGRDRELQSLLLTLTQPSAVVMIEGEAGVGKSRLVDELLRQCEAQFGRALVGCCQPLHEPFPYGAVLEALSTLRGQLPPAADLNPVTGALRSLLPELATELPDELEPLPDPRAHRHRLFRAVRELLGSGGPRLLVIEDLHLADDGSRQLMRFLMSDPPDDVRILVTYRREDVPGGLPLGTAFRPRAGGTSMLVSLRPLSADDVRTMTSAILDGQSVSDEFAAILRQRTAGIPFVVEETLRALRNPAGAVQADSDRAQRLLENVEVPALLRDAVAERLAVMSTAARRLVQAAAVFGIPASAETIGAVAGITASRCRAALTQAIHSGVLHEVDGETYGFRHALARQAVYDTLAGPERQQLHVRSLRALEDSQPHRLMQLATHSTNAGLDGKWRTYGEAAADAAAHVGDHFSATQLLQKLLTGPGLAGRDVDRLAVKLGQVAQAGLDQHDPVATLKRLLTDARLSTAARGEVRFFLGLLLIRQADSLEQSRRQLTRAIAELDDRPDLAARGASVLAQPYLGTLPIGEHQPWMQRVEDHLQRLGDSDPELVISLLANQLSALLHTGDPTVLERIGQLPETVTRSGEQRQLARVYCNTADACTAIGLFKLARTYLAQGFRLGAECGAPFIISTARATEARLDWWTGQWSGLEERVDRLHEEYRDLLPVASELELVHGTLAAARGDWDRASDHFHAAGTDAPEDSITTVLLAAIAGLVSIRLDRHEVEHACQLADQGVDILRRKGIWAWSGEIAPAVVSAYLQGDRVTDAQALVEEMSAGLRGREAPLALAALEGCRASIAEALGDAGEASDLYRSTMERYLDMGAPFAAALTEERLVLCKFDGDPDGALPDLSRLEEEFDRLGATRDAARCRQEIRSRGGAQPSRRGRRSYGNQLSPREQEVARLLARRLTNREIADVLFLSPRTVEQHVARVLRKLGVTSRTDVVGEQLVP